MKSVSILVSTLGTGGAEKQAAILAQVLSRNYKVIFVALYGEPKPSEAVLKFLREPNIRVFSLNGSLFKKIKTYAFLLKENSVSCSFNYLTMPDFLGSIVERCCHVDKIFNGIRSTRLDNYKYVLEWVSHNFIATGTIFNCYSGEVFFRRKRFKASKCFIIPNVFPNISNSLERSEKIVKKVITVGRFQREKDFETAIKVIALLKQKNIKVIFVICGYGLLESQIRNWVEVYKVSDMVELHINPNNIPLLLHSSDIYLSTSLYEGTSNSIMEAMNWSLPIVATKVGDNDRLIIDGESGFLHPVGDVEGMAASLCLLLDSTDLRNKMGKKGNQNLRGNYSMELFENRYLQLIGD